MVNARLSKTARLIHFLRARDFLSIEKEIETPRRSPIKIRDDETPGICILEIEGLKNCNSSVK